MRILTVLLLAAVLGGCGPRPPEPTLMTHPPAPSTAAATVPAETCPDTAEYYIEYVYPEQLRQYYTALVGRWDGQKLLLHGRSPRGADFLQGDPLENVGFLLEDLDGDGSRELLIGAIRDAREAPLIFELWTAGEEEPELVLCAGEGERYFLLEGSACIIAREEDGQVRRRAFEGGALSHRQVDAAPGAYWVPRYYPFFLYSP